MRRRRAITYAELVIVVAVIGVLAAIAIPRMTQVTPEAGDGTATVLLARLRAAIEMYASEEGAWPGGGGEGLMV